MSNRDARSLGRSSRKLYPNGCGGTANGSFGLGCFFAPRFDAESFEPVDARGFFIILIGVRGSRRTLFFTKRLTAASEARDVRRPSSIGQTRNASLTAARPCNYTTKTAFGQAT